MALWPFVVAGVWCCVMVPWFVRARAQAEKLKAQWAPINPPPWLRGPARIDYAIGLPFWIYHLPVVLPVMWLSLSHKANERDVLLALMATIFLTAALYSVLFTWVL